MHYRNFYLVLILMFQGFLSYGQTGTNSPYTRFGYGTIEYVGFGKSQAMGGIGIATRTNANMSPLNPASYSAIDTLSQIFELGISGMGTQYKNATSSGFDANMNFNYLGLGFPATKWWGIGIGVMPVTYVGYDYGISTTDTETTINYSYTGDGGISKVFFGNAFEISKQLSLGVNVNYMFGSLNYYRSNNFPNHRDYISFYSEENIKISSLQYTLGVQYIQPINDNSRLVFGAIFEPKTSLNAKLDLNTYRTIPSANTATLIVDNIQDKSIEMEFPQSYGLGVNYELNNKLLLGADYYFQQFGDVKFYGTDSLINRTRVAIGAEYTPNYIAQSYLKRIHYRLGANVSNNYQKVYGDDIIDFGITFGLGLPLGYSKTSFNVAFEYGKRGTTNDNLVQEDYLKVILNLSLNDVWFLKRKFK